MQNVMSIDVEDYFHVANFTSQICFNDWDKYELRVEKNTTILLELFSSHGIKATFFILAWVAERCPQLIQNIHKEGHEIACHSYHHELIYEQGKERFREDTHRAKSIIEDIIGTKIIGYRAPSYSITNKSLWAVDILLEEGFVYDSSIFPTHHDRYGIPDAPRHSYSFTRGEKELQEFPPSTIPLLKWNFPIAGGGYFRLFPYKVTQKSIEYVNKENKPFIFYLHPWEIDPQQPKVSNIGFLKSFRHYVNISQTEKKLKKLLDDFNFTSIAECFGLKSNGKK